MSPWPAPTEDGALCCICFEWTHIDNLSVDSEDGKKWDICKECDKIERAAKQVLGL